MFGLALVADDEPAPIQIAILEELTKLVRDGQYAGNAGKPSAIVLIGHSYGSGITNALIASNPTIADAATLTGMEYASPNNFGIDIVLAFGLRVASTQAPPRFADRDTGYLTWPDVYQHAEL